MIPYVKAKGNIYKKFTQVGRLNNKELWTHLIEIIKNMIKNDRNRNW
jgi:hypothetical protein